MRIAIVTSLALAFSCAHNVPQDKATTADGRIKGAKKLALDNGVASDSGIVTYPGGDRVDWKLVELPEKHRGSLEVTLAWNPPRPGLKLAVDVFDEWNAQVATTAKVRGTGRKRSLTIDNARGKYFIRVYAVRRGDAGRYKLDVEFRDTIAARTNTIDWTKVEVPEPPKLADLPTTAPSEGEACTAYNFNPKNKGCTDVCPFPISQPPTPTWPGCKNICTASPPDKNIKACADTMICPSRGSPDRDIKDCMQYFKKPCPDPANPDANNPWCDADKITITPVYAIIKGDKIVGDEIELHMIQKTKGKIDKTWTAVLLAGGTDSEQPASDLPMSNSSITITQIDGSTIRGRGKIGIEQVRKNKWVKISPPKK